jgi:basic membrane protein A
MSKKLPIRFVAVLGAALIALSGCAAAPDQEAAPTASEFCARMVTNSGGLHDRSFNESSWAGLRKAEREYSIGAKVLVSTGETDLIPNVEQAVESGCGFVLTVGYELAPATEKAAKANPKTEFAIVDEVVDAKNVKPIIFDTAQAAFLAGYLAAGVSKTHKVGTFGGGNQPPVTLFMDGFADGVAKYNEVHGTSVEVHGWSKATQDGSFTGDFEDTTKGYALANSLIEQGVDVILPVAGQVGEGAAAAAADAAGMVSLIWVDNDGYDTLPARYRGFLLTSVLKNTEQAVATIARSSQDGTFDNTPFVGTLKNGGVGIAPFHDMAARVSAQLSAEVKALQADIVSGKLVVTSPSTPK